MNHFGPEMKRLSELNLRWCERHAGYAPRETFHGRHCAMCENESKQRREWARRHPELTLRRRRAA